MIRFSVPLPQWLFLHGQSVLHALSCRQKDTSSPTDNPPVGKSGPLTISISSAIVISGVFNHPDDAVDHLGEVCGGMFVAIPTAIPDDRLPADWATPLEHLRFFKVPSKLSRHSTVSFSISCNISFVIRAILFLCTASLQQNHHRLIQSFPDRQLADIARRNPVPSLPGNRTPLDPRGGGISKHFSDDSGGFLICFS